jgi:hypothetical protein
MGEVFDFLCIRLLYPEKEYSHPYIVRLESQETFGILLTSPLP